MKRIVKMIVEFVGLLIVGCVLLIMVQMLPINRIQYHIEESAEWLSEEGDYPYMGSREQAYLVDNWTEATLLTFNYTADSKRPVYSAFVATSYMPPSSTGVSRLQAVTSEEWQENVDFISTRGSNWIGYNIFLRLGLCFFSLSELRVILNVISYSIVLLTLLMIYKFQGGYRAFGLGLTLLLYNFYTLSVSWSLGVFCVMIACLAIMYILTYNGNADYFNLMFIVGIITAYFDWLSIPLVTWGLPIGFILRKEYESKNDNRFKAYFMILVKSGLGWCIGYASMIFSKIVIAIGIQGTEAWEFFVERLTADTKAQSLRAFCQAVYQLVCAITPLNILPEDSILPVILVGIVAFLQAFVIVRFKQMRSLSFSYLLVCCAPLVYYVYAKGHIGHVAIEFRSLMISCYATLLMLEPMCHEIVNSKMILHKSDV